MINRILALLVISTVASYGAANDLLIAQRNSTDTGQLTRLVAHPGGSQNGFVVYNGSSLLPQIVLLGDGLSWGSGQVDVTMSTAMTAALATKQDTITAGTSADYYRGDKTWQTLSKSSVGLSNVENTALSTWGGSSNVVTVGTVASGVWQGTPVTDTYINSAATWNGKLSPTGNGSGLTGLTKSQVGLSNVENTALSTWNGSSNVTTLGTVSTGTWQGTAIANAYIASASTWNAKEPAITSGTTSQYWRGDKTWQTLATVGVTGSYNDLSNKPTIPSAQIQSDWAQSNNAAVDYIKNKPTAPAITNNPSRTIQTVAAAANGWQISATNTSFVSYSVTITANATGLIAGASTGYVVLETASTNSSTAGNWLEIARSSNGQAFTSILTLTSSQPVGSTIAAYIQPGYYLRLRSVNVNGTPSYAINSSQEVIIS